MALPTGLEPAHGGSRWTLLYQLSYGSEGSTRPALPGGEIRGTGQGAKNGKGRYRPPQGLRYE